MKKRHRDYFNHFRRVIVVRRPLLVPLLLVLSAASISCRTSTPAPPPEQAEATPAPSPPPGPTVALRASQTAIDPGSPVTLLWESQNASTVRIDPGVGEVAVSGNRPVSPSSSVTYTAVATGPGGSATASVRITVSTPPAAAPPAPAPETSIRDLFGSSMQPVYFDFDGAEIRPDQIGRLQSAARFLTENTAVQFTIEGHADERGSQEYNIGLGERRANAVREFLMSQGVAASRVQTVSYGEERPVCTQPAEGCWSENRRAEYTMREPAEAGIASGVAGVAAGRLTDR